MFIIGEVRLECCIIFKCVLYSSVLNWSKANRLMYPKPRKVVGYFKSMDIYYKKNSTTLQKDVFHLFMNYSKELVIPEKNNLKII